jgi:hypothetical protein
MSETPGWKAWKEKTESDIREVGQKAVEGFFEDVKERDEALLRANERLQVIKEVERMASAAPRLEEKVKRITANLSS